MQDMNFIMMPVPASKFEAVCAVLAGGASVGAIATASATRAPARQPEGTETAGTGAGDGPQATALKDAGLPAAGAAASDAGDGTVDAGGHPWSPDLHASTKGMTKEGYWRMKVGVSRPDPLPGFPKTGDAAAGATGTSENGAASASSAPAASDNAGQDDDDEFAAFRDAAAKANGTDAAAAASVPARKWTDADLGKLCNQAAVKLGDPTPVKEIIGQYVPDGQVPHSRNIPDDQREAFAQAVELKAGIEFATA